MLAYITLPMHVHVNQRCHDIRNKVHKCAARLSTVDIMKSLYMLKSCTVIIIIHRCARSKVASGLHSIILTSQAKDDARETFLILGFTISQFVVTDSFIFTRALPLST